ncbi:hypothetical protein BLNAU_23121 [Blattamonas nauphoetae]|uniref:Uncharacterized protein n=1 Tax=Blattamonas nauphoetae TaxID=2049346 RepID=A0ABQ9WRL6_9EUKA|nr:hypothetical protein BLNAU_23121 [Blattamonas nauphoetae]
MTLPPLLFTDPSYFVVDCTTLTRSRIHFDFQRYLNKNSVLLKTPITQGIVSVTLTILSVPIHVYDPGRVLIGLLDSTAAVPEMAQCLGYEVQDSVLISSSTGLLYLHHRLIEDIPRKAYRRYNLRNGDCVRMEVDMDSNPRTVQFFVNGHNKACFVSYFLGKALHSELTESRDNPDQLQ